MSETVSLYVVHCLDAPGMQDKRIELTEAHRRYVAEQGERIFFGGPLFDETDGRRVGSLIVLKAAGREQARAFMEAEPYCANGVFESVQIRAFQCVTRPDAAVRLQQQSQPEGEQP